MDPTKELLELGISLFNRRRYADAIRSFEEALRRGAAGAETRCFLAHACISAGEQCLLAGKLAEAEDYLRRASQADAGQVRAHAVRGALLRAQGQSREARRAYAEAVRLDPSAVDARLCLARLLSEEGDREGACAQAREAVRAAPRSAQVRTYLGQTLEDRGDTQGARQEYREALSLDPACTDALLRLGGLLLREGACAEAERLIARAPPGPRGAEILMLLGRAQEAAGRKDEARRRYEEAVRLCAETVRREPGNAAARVLLGEAFETCGRPDEARREYEEAARLGSGAGKAQTALGRLSLKNGDPEEALRRLEDAARREPESAAARMLLGEALEACGRSVEARQRYEEAVGLGADPREAQIALGRLLSKGGRQNEAIRRLAEAVQREPGDAAARLLLGEALEASGRPDEARLEYEKAGALGSGSGKAQAALGRLSLKDGNPREALRRLEEATRREPESPGARVLLGEALEACGRSDEARQRYEEAVLLDPDSAEARFHLGMSYLHAEMDRPMRTSLKAFLGCRSDPAMPACPSRRFIALLALGEYEEAFRQAEAILDSGQDLMGYGSRFEPWTYGDVRRTHSQEFYAERLRGLDALPRRTHGTPWKWFYKGMALFRLGRDREGLAAMDKIAGCDAHRYGWMRHAAGVRRLALGRVSRAVVDLESAVRSVPTAWLSRCFLAEAFVSLGKDAEALEQLAQAQGSCVSMAAACEVRTWRGAVLLWLGRYDDAVQDLDWALSRGKAYEQELAPGWRGAAHMLAGRFEMAEADLDLALAVRPKDIEALVFRGELMRRMGRVPEARRDLERALASGYHIWAELNLALLSASSGDSAGLWTHFSRIPRRLASASLRRPHGRRRKDLREEDACRALTALLDAACGIRRIDRHLELRWFRRLRKG